MPLRENRFDYSVRKTHPCKMHMLSNPKRCLTRYLDSFHHVAKQAYENIGGDACLQ
jgi:hypothetical protein